MPSSSYDAGSHDEANSWLALQDVGGSYLAPLWAALTSWIINGFTRLPLQRSGLHSWSFGFTTSDPTPNQTRLAQIGAEREQRPLGLI